MINTVIVILIIYLVGIVVAYSILNHEDWQKSLAVSLPHMHPKETAKWGCLFSWIIVFLACPWWLEKFANWYKNL